MKGMAWRVMLVMGVIAGLSVTSCKDDDEEEKPIVVAAGDTIELDTVAVHAEIMNAVFYVDSGTTISFRPKYGKKLSEASDKYTASAENESMARTIFKGFLPLGDTIGLKESMTEIEYEMGDISMKYTVGGGDEIAHVSFSSREVAKYELSFISAKQWPENDGSSPVIVGMLYKRGGKYYVGVESGDGHPGRVVTFDFSKQDYGYASKTKDYEYGIFNEDERRWLTYWNGSFGAYEGGAYQRMQVANEACLQSLWYLVGSNYNRDRFAGLKETWDQHGEGRNSETYKYIVNKEFLNKKWPVGTGNVTWYQNSYWGFKIYQGVFDGKTGTTATYDSGTEYCFSPFVWAKNGGDCTGKDWYSSGFVTMIEIENNGNTMEQEGFEEIY